MRAKRYTVERIVAKLRQAAGRGPDDPADL
jgi:hypothetical protein